MSMEPIPFGLWVNTRSFWTAFGADPRTSDGDNSRRCFAGLDMKKRKGAVSGGNFSTQLLVWNISLHQPHPRNELKSYQVREVLDHLKQEGCCRDFMEYKGYIGRCGSTLKMRY